MPRSDDLVLCHLLARLKHLSAAALRELRTGAANAGTPLTDLLTQAGRISPTELSGYQEAARYLIGGDHPRACPACPTQVYGPPAPKAPCPRCGRAMIRGVLPSPEALEFDARLERQVRRLILDATARAHAKGTVREASRLRAEGRIGRRTEAELAPADRSCAEGVLGRYRLIELVGRGASSYVYKAEDRSRGGTVALKVLYFHPEDPKAVVEEKLARFRREAELASRLDHPNLVAVGALEQAGTWHLMPMAFIDGPSLAQLLEARRSGAAPEWNLAALATSLTDVARGLHYAHCQGVVHRDVNPRNVLFTSAGQALLSDFGVARPLETAGALTGKRVVLGTIAYAAPERLESERLAGVRSDVYSLGVVLYEILTGRVPFEETDPAHLLVRIRREAPVAPTELNPEVTPALARVALRALAKDEASRHASALDFAEDLAAAAAGEALPAADAVEASAPDGAPRAASWRRAAALLVLGFAAGVGAVSVPLGGAAAARADRLRELAAAYAGMVAAPTPDGFRSRRADLARAIDAAEAVWGSRSGEVQYWRGELAQAHGDWGAAVIAFGRATESGGYRSPAHLGRGVAGYFLAERYGNAPAGARHREAARADFEILARERAGSWEGRVAAAMIAALGDDGDGAFSALHELARENLTRLEAPLLQAWVALRHGAPAVAAGILEPLSERAPGPPAVRLALALAYAAAGDSRRALVQANALCEACPDLPEAWAVAAEAHAAAGDEIRAREALDAALRLAPGVPAFHARKAGRLARQGAECEAIAAWSAVLDLDPSDAEALWRRGALRSRHGDAAAAEADLRRYLERFPEGPRAPAIRAWLARLR